MKEKIVKEVKEIINEQMDRPKDYKITTDMHLADDLSVDSLDAVEIIMEIESRYDIEIPTETALSIEHFSDILDYLEENL
ncbi:MAG: acyl carrier protein [Bacillota bacterium]